MTELFVMAFLAGTGVALVAGPLGCFMVWRRMAYFGDTMAHAALLGVALGVVLGISPMLGVIAVGVVIALSLMLSGRKSLLADDTMLGILAHGALAVGLVVLALTPGAPPNVMNVLFGDVLAVTTAQLLWGWGGGALVLGGLVWIWRDLLAVTVHEDLARVEGVAVDRTKFLYMILIALAVAGATKVVGALMITALLIIPAATARRFARTPEGMAVTSGVVGTLAVLLGLAGAFAADTPVGPSIVVAALVLFLLSTLGR